MLAYSERKSIDQLKSYQGKVKKMKYINIYEFLFLSLSLSLSLSIYIYIYIYIYTHTHTHTYNIYKKMN